MQEDNDVQLGEIEALEKRVQSLNDAAKELGELLENEQAGMQGERSGNKFSWQ